MKRVSCWQCQRYDRNERRCKDGKTNPKKRSDTVEVAEQLGVQTICLYNPYRDMLALRQYFPHRTLLHSPLQNKKRRPQSEIISHDDIEKPVEP